MKKILLAAAFAALSVMGVSAQDYLLNNPSNRAYFGIRVGGEVTCPGKFKANGESVKVFKNGGGFEAGAIYNVPVVANFYVEPGLKLYYTTPTVSTTRSRTLKTSSAARCANSVCACP